MAKTFEQNITENFGNLMMQLIRVCTERDALQEQVAELKKKVEELSAEKPAQ